MSTTKIIIIGNGGVGKSSFIKTINTDIFQEKYESTIGYNKHNMKFLTNRGKIDIQLIDTAGQETIGTVHSDLYNDIDAAILMFDLTSRITYNAIPTWYRDLQKITQNKNLPVVIVGNKLDLERKVKQNTITYPKKNNIPYIETSIKNRDNLIHVFNELFPKIFKDDGIKCVINDQKSPIKKEESSKKRKLDEEESDNNEKEDTKKTKEDTKKTKSEESFKLKSSNNPWYFF